MKRLLIIIVFCIGIISAKGQNFVTYPFTNYDTTKLYLDLYQPQNPIQAKNICLVFVFGGGFTEGQRNGEFEKEYCQKLTQEGYTVAAIDYRLGLKGVTSMGITAVKTLEHAIDIAVEDLYHAISYLVNNAEKFSINKDNIIICGSSAGAITALQADYYLCNNHSLTQILPKGFQFAGIISFSGAIFSRNGKIKYRCKAPAPTLLFHGTDDKLVTYNQIRFFNLGFIGTNKIVPRLKKNNYPFYAFRYQERGHEVAAMVTENISITKWFIDQYIIQKKNIQIDKTYWDSNYERPWYSTIRPSKLYKKINGKNKSNNNLINNSRD